MAMNELLLLVNSNSSKSLDKLIDEKVNTAIDKINTAINDISIANSTLNRGFVKSVQRGSVSLSERDKSREINISSVNMSKSIILINGKGRQTIEFRGEGYYYFKEGFSGELLNNNTIRVSHDGDSSNSSTAIINWQVVEFY